MGIRNRNSFFMSLTKFEVLDLSSPLKKECVDSDAQGDDVKDSSAGIHFFACIFRSDCFVYRLKHLHDVQFPCYVVVALDDRYCD